MSVKMSGRERVLKVLNHEIPDRVPCYEVLIDPPMVEFILGIKDKNSMQITPHELVRLHLELGLDCIISGLRFSRPADQINGGMPPVAGLQPPLQAEQELMLERVREIAEIAHAEGLAVAAYNHGCFDVIYESMGFENFMYALHDDFSYVEDLAQKLFEYHYENTKKALETGIDFMLIGDDLAYKTGIFIHPDQFMKLWYTREKAMIQLVRKAGKPVEFHSDGKLDFVLPHLVEMGIAAINPIEPYSNDIRMIKEQWGDKIAIRGNVDVGGNLSTGTYDDVYRETAQLISDMKPGGNYICSSSHSISKAVKPENYLALVKAVADFGQYQ